MIYKKPVLNEEEEKLIRNAISFNRELVKSLIVRASDNNDRNEDKEDYEYSYTLEVDYSGERYETTIELYSMKKLFNQIILDMEYSLFEFINEKGEQIEL